MYAACLLSAAAATGPAVGALEKLLVARNIGFRLQAEGFKPFSCCCPLWPYFTLCSATLDQVSVAEDVGYRVYALGFKV